MKASAIAAFFAASISLPTFAARIAPATRMEIPAPSVEDGTMPPAEYVKDYWAPPADWFPVQPVADYTIQTYIPEFTWLKYDGTYALELKVAPADAAEIEKNIAAELINTNKNVSALTWNDKFADEKHRRQIAVKNLDRGAENLAAFAFKLRASDPALAAKGVKATLRGKNFLVEADTSKAQSFGEIAKTAKDAVDLRRTLAGKLVSEPAKGGFVQYRVEFAPAAAGSKLDEIVLEFPAVAKEAPRPVFEIIDLHCKLREKEAQFTDLPQRQWIEKAKFESGAKLKASDGIADVNAWMDEHPEATMELPLDNPRLASGAKCSGYRIENLTLDPKTLKPVEGGKGIPALRVTFKKGEKTYLKFAKRFNGIEYNTIGLYAKVEVPKDVRPFGFYNEEYSGFQGALNPLGHNDVFGFGYYSATFDHVEWGKWMVAPGHNKVYEQKTAAPLPDGWKKIAFDNRYSDPAHNKTTILDSVTDWFIAYDNSTIGEGKEVVITIARPRVAKGLMHAGGDMEAYRKFLADEPNRLLKNCGKFDYRKYLGAPEEGKLASPIPFIREHEPLGEFVFPREHGAIRDLKPFRKTVTDAFDYFEELLKNKYGLTRNIPRLGEPSKADNVKIFVGGDYYARLGEAEKAQYRQDRETLKDTTGFAIRSKGKNIYVYAGTFEDFGSMLGLANGVYALIEGNTDEISVFNGRGAPFHVRVFGFESTGEMDLVWGDGYVENPPFSRAHCFYANGVYLRRNRSVAYEAGWDSESYWAGGNRKLYTGHWLAHYGSVPGLYAQPADADPGHERWGMGPDGQRVKPDCYTRHCCMVNVIDHAKEDWLHLGRVRAGNDRVPYKYNWQFYDTWGYWLEDNDKWCLCDKCRTPIRLADGSSIGPENALFRGVQYFSNASAMLHAVNVWINRSVRCQTIGYFWMNTPPPFQLSRNWEVCYCPYFRKNYFEPVYAPVNDLWARDLYRWGQVPGVKMILYDYFLGVNLRPWEIAGKYDVVYERDCGITEVRNEGGNMFSSMALWSLLRQFRRADADPRESDRFFIARTYREAAPAMEKFYSCINEFIFENIARRTYMEMEDYAIIGVIALRTPSKKSGVLGRMSVLDELEGYIREAQEAVKTPLAAKALDAFVNGFKGGDGWCFRVWCDEARKRAADHQWPEK